MYYYFKILNYFHLLFLNISKFNILKLFKIIYFKGNIFRAAINSAN